MSNCRSCNAPVRWVKTMRGKNHPLDAVPVEDGDWVIRPSANGPMMIQHTPLQKDAPRFTSHFATCPEADQHRKRGK